MYFDVSMHHVNGFFLSPLEPYRVARAMQRRFLHVTLAAGYGSSSERKGPFTGRYSAVNSALTPPPATPLHTPPAYLALSSQCEKGYLHGKFPSINPPHWLPSLMKKAVHAQMYL